MSLQIQNELQSIFRKHTNDRASVYVIDKLLKIEGNFYLKDKQPLLIKPGIVYKLNC